MHDLPKPEELHRYLLSADVDCKTHIVVSEGALIILMGISTVISAILTYIAWHSGTDTVVMLAGMFTLLCFALLCETLISPIWFEIPVTSKALRTVKEALQTDTRLVYLRIKWAMLYEDYRVAWEQLYSDGPNNAQLRAILDENAPKWRQPLEKCLQDSIAALEACHDGQVAIVREILLQHPSIPDSHPLKKRVGLSRTVKSIAAAKAVMAMQEPDVGEDNDTCITHIPTPQQVEP